MSPVDDLDGTTYVDVFENKKYVTTAFLLIIKRFQLEINYLK